MACNSCAKSFSLLRKEKGCPGCGFSYCSKCLTNEVFLPKLNREAKVCLKCKRNAATPNESKVCPPDAYYKRLGVLDTGTDNASNNDPKDQEILERLQKLKADKMAAASSTTETEIRKRLQKIKGETASTSDTELQARLAKLRGVPTETLTSKPVLPPPDTRSEQDQIHDLMKQYMEQMKIDSKYKNEFDVLISDMETRMQKLKGSGTGTTSKNEFDVLISDVESRMHKLKGSGPDITSKNELDVLISDVESRMQKLKGSGPDITSKNELDVLISDVKSRMQKLKGSGPDITLKNELDVLISDVESKMQKLKGSEPGTILKNEFSPENEVESEDEEELKKIVQKIKAEASLEDSDVSSSKNDELPFCEICNEDAIMRCLGCRYLFCKQCFLEHKDDDDGCDKYELYAPPKDHQ